MNCRRCTYSGAYVTHKDGIGFCYKEMPEPYTTDIALCFVIDAVNDDYNALALFMLLI